MDPTRTLVTFTFHTDPDVQSVQLLGSWDNFSTSYPMERDLRRGKGEWKGCHAFRDVPSRPSEGHLAKIRNGGLKMGATYHYYYEVDGSTETYDTTMPTTTASPYLPGQTVNTLTVPTQQSTLQRSASLTSMRISDYKTMKPEAKFCQPRPLPEVSFESPNLRKRSAPGLRSSSSTQSFMATPAWRRIFSNKVRDDDRGRSPERDSRAASPTLQVYDERSTSAASSNRSRTRSISPESLRRFLSDDVPTARPGSNLSERPTLIIPDEIMEENEDDEDFAISAVSEANPYTTKLSPPPFKRSSAGSTTAPLTMANLSSLTLTTMRPSSSRRNTGSLSGDFLVPSQTESAALTSATSSALASPLSAIPPEEEMLTFYDDSNDDDERHDRDAEGVDQDATVKPPFINYILPDNGATPEKPKAKPRLDLGRLHAGIDSGSLSTGRSSYLISPIATGFGIDDFVSELGWMVDMIGNKPE